MECLGIRSKRDGLKLEKLVNGVILRSTQNISKVNFWVSMEDLLWKERRNPSQAFFLSAS